MKLPDLFARDSKNRIKQWCIEVGEAMYITRNGLLNGTLDSNTTFCSSKRGTTAQEQAEKEAIARWKKQHKKGYRETIELADAAPKRPALCQDYKDNSHKLIFPVRTGPKLNGMRVMAVLEDGKYVGYSRELNDVPIPTHIQKHLQQMPYLPNVIDGEFYVHGMHLQDIISLVKRPLEEGQFLRSGVKRLQFRIFDLPDEKRLAEERMTLLECLAVRYPRKDSDCVQFVPAILVHDDVALMQYHKEFVRHGYEGSVARSCCGKYGYGLKTAAMMKIKDFQDAEFEIVDIIPDKNGLAVAICTTLKGQAFKATFEGCAEFESNTEYKQHIMAKPELFIGKKATVRFQDYSKDDIPTIGNNISAIRDYE